MRSNQKTRKIVESKETILLDKDGEVFADEKSRIYRIPQEPPYVKLYLDTVMYLCDLQERHTGVLMAIVRLAPFADLKQQRIVLNRSIKLEIAKDLGKSETYVSHAIAELAKGNILIHDDRTPRSSSYQINPHIIARGEWKDIKNLRLSIDFNAEGKTFWSEVQIAKKIAEDQKYCDQKRAEYFAQRAANENQNAEQSEAEQNL